MAGEKIFNALARNLAPGKIKTTPIRFFGNSFYFNAGAKIMARRADKVNDKKIDEAIDTLFAEIANDAKLGLYYGIYTVRIECLNLSLSKLRRKNYLIIQLGADTDYVYLALYWGHWTTLDNPRLFAKFFASFISETALYSGNKDIYADKGRGSREFPSKFKDKIKYVSRDYWKQLKEVSKTNYKLLAIDNVCENLVLQTVAKFVSLLKGGTPLYVPDPACRAGIIKMSKNSGNNVDTAVKGMRRLVEVFIAAGIWDEFASYHKKFKKSNLYDDCIKAAIKMDRSYNDQLELENADKVLQVLQECKARTSEEVKLIKKQLEIKGLLPSKN